MSSQTVKNRQSGVIKFRLKLIVAASFFVIAAVILIVVFHIGDVKDSHAFSSGDYRSISDGEWNDPSVWEVYNGSSWGSALMPPGDGTKRVLISANSKMIITDEITISNLIIESGAVLNLETNSLKIYKKDAKGELLCEGTLDMGTCIIEGDADVILGTKATLAIGSDAGIDRKGNGGNLQLTGKRELSKDATFIFNGSVKQHTGNGLPPMMRYLIIDNPSGVNLDQNLLIVNKLSLISGTLYTDKYSLSIGSSHANPGEIFYSNGNVCGKLKRWYGISNAGEIVFPVSDGISTSLFSFSSVVPEYQIGLIELIYHEGFPDDKLSSPFEIRHVVIGFTQKGYYTAYLTNGPDEAVLKMTGTSELSSSSKTSWQITRDKVVTTPSSTKKKNVESKPVRNQNFQNILCGPNPFLDNLFIRFYCDENSVAFVQLMNEGGQMVVTDTVHTEKGFNQFKVSKTSTLDPGVYVLRLSNSAEIHTMKVVKESN